MTAELDPVRIYEELFKVEDALRHMSDAGTDPDVFSEDFKEALYGLGCIAIESYGLLPESVRKRFDFDVASLESQLGRIKPKNT